MCQYPCNKFATGERNVGRGNSRGMARAQKPALNRDSLLQENAQLRARYDTLRSSRTASNLTAVTKTLIRCAMVFGCVWVCARYFSGQTTYLWATIDAKISSSTLEEIAKSLGPPWWLNLTLFTGSSVAAVSNVRYRRLNRILVQRVANLTQVHEIGVDPGRSSSGLGSLGQTNEKDHV